MLLRRLQLSLRASCAPSLLLCGDGGARVRRARATKRLPVSSRDPTSSRNSGLDRQQTSSGAELAGDGVVAHERSRRPRSVDSSLADERRSRSTRAAARARAGATRARSRPSRLKQHGRACPSGTALRAWSTATRARLGQLLRRGRGESTSWRTAATHAGQWPETSSPLDELADCLEAGRGARSKGREASRSGRERGRRRGRGAAERGWSASEGWTSGAGPEATSL